MTKLSNEEQDFVLSHIAHLIAHSENITDRTIAENIRDKILDDYEMKIRKSKSRTESLKAQLEKLKNNIN